MIEMPDSSYFISFRLRPSNTAGYSPKWYGLLPVADITYFERRTDSDKGSSSSKILLEDVRCLIGMLLPVTAESVGICDEVCGKRPEETLGGGFKYCLFPSLFGEMIQFDEHIFQMG